MRNYRGKPKTRNSVGDTLNFYKQMSAKDKLKKVAAAADGAAAEPKTEQQKLNEKKAAEAADFKEEVPGATLPPATKSAKKPDAAAELNFSEVQSGQFDFFKFKTIGDTFLGTYQGRAEESEVCEGKGITGMLFKSYPDGLNIVISDYRAIVKFLDGQVANSVDLSKKVVRLELSNIKEGAGQNGGPVYVFRTFVADLPNA